MVRVIKSPPTWTEIIVCEVCTSEIEVSEEDVNQRFALEDGFVIGCPVCGADLWSTMPPEQYARRMYQFEIETTTETMLPSIKRLGEVVLHECEIYQRDHHAQSYGNRIIRAVRNYADADIVPMSVSTACEALLKLHKKGLIVVVSNGAEPFGDYDAEGLNTFTVNIYEEGASESIGYAHHDNPFTAILEAYKQLP